MTPRPRRQMRRPNMRRAVLLFPSGFTLGNLFFGVFAIIAASRQEFTTAGVYVLLGGICDALDGRVARATNAGSQFGEELDSLVDAITFGLAPGMIMFFAVLNRDGWDWVWVFIVAACAVMRLARFNIEQAGTAKTYFQGLPSPAAGITLASYYWFSQSWLYNYGAIADLKWHVMLRFLMVALSVLMISNVPYPTFPRTGFRSLKALGATIVLVGSIVLLFLHRLEFFFPMALIYVAWGVLRWVFYGLFERRQPTLPYDLSEGEDEEEEEELVEVVEVPARRSHRDEAVRGRDRGGRPERPARTDRPDRAERAPKAERTDRPERPERPERGDRPERPQRTEAERAARKEKREKRDQRDRARAERAAAAPAATGPSAITMGEDVTEESADEALVGRIPGGADAAESSSGGTAEGAPARKRKRRRRRGERRPREGAGTGESTGEGTSESGGESAGESGGSGESGRGDEPERGGESRADANAPERSPYSPSQPIITPPPSEPAE